MKNAKFTLIIGAFFLLLLNIQCDKDILDPDLSAQKELMKSINAAKPDGETAGNNLSYPVIWSDGASLALRGDRTLPPKLDGAWYYVWGEDPIDPQAPLYSCLPNPADPTECIDGTTPWGSDPHWKAFVQKDALNEWQAWNYNGLADGLWVIDSIDWGDNLESVNWTIASQVRTEVVLYEGIPEYAQPDPAPYYRQYAMRHAFGWGITEVHGLQTEPDNTLLPEILDNPATVYSPNARLTIQKINVESLDELPADNTGLTWDPAINGWDDPLFNPPIFNEAVWQGGDGPGFYSAEVNVKGKVIYGFTWNVRKLNDGVGYYRITFSFDDFSPFDLNTEINATTKIIVPLEEEEEAAIILAAEEGGDTGGATPEIDDFHKLTYIDVLITEKQRGAGGGNGGGKANNPGGGTGGGKDGNIGNGSGGSGSGSGNGRK